MAKLDSIEICGSYKSSSRSLILRGNTYEYRETIKAHKGRFGKDSDGAFWRVKGVANILALLEDLVGSDNP
jgi:hypothetical protein